MAPKPILDRSMDPNHIPDADVVLLSAPEGFYSTLPIGAYPDGMPLVNHPETLPSCFTMLLRPSSFASFMAAMFFVDAVRERDAYASIRLVLPNIPGARQDRMNPTGDFLFTAKSVAREINARQFSSVVVLDPHSEVAPALINRCNVVHVEYRTLVFGDINAHRYAGVISPDAGAEKRASIIARSMGLPLVHAWKTRNVKDGTISGFGSEAMSAGHYLVVDDICDGGGTFIGLANVLAKGPLSADLYVTHGYFTKGTQPLLDCFKRVYCTDSVIGEKPGVVVVPVCNLLARGVGA